MNCSLGELKRARVKNVETSTFVWLCLICYHEHNNYKSFSDDKKLLKHVCSAHNESDFFKPFKKLIKFTSMGVTMGIVR